jgi:putative membrane protein
MRLGLILLALLFAIGGAAFGALNGEHVIFDFYFSTLTLPKGAALLCAVLLGWLLGGGVVYVGLVLRLRRRVRVLTRELKHKRSEEPPAAIGGNAP